MDPAPPTDSSTSMDFIMDSSTPLSPFLTEEKKYERPPLPLDDKEYKPPLHPRDHLKPPYRFSSRIVEEHGLEIYDVKFCPFFKDEDFFAVASDKQVTVYKCVGKAFEAIAVFQDDAETDHYYSVNWVLPVFDGKRSVHLVIGTERGLIRTIDPFAKRGNVSRAILRGHTGHVNAISVHPEFLSIIASASQDLTIRVWHCFKEISFAVLSGHDEQVLTVDFHNSGRFLVSGAMDQIVRVWNIGANKELSTKIKQAKMHIFNDDTTVDIYNSDALNRDFLAGYVDCVKFVGSFIFSKSTDGPMALWKFGEFNDSYPSAMGDGHLAVETSVHTLAELEIPDCGKWFIRFGVTIGSGPGESWIACGNEKKIVSLWDIKAQPIPVRSHYQITHNLFPRLIRKVEFNRNGKIMVVVGNGGIVCRCDKRPDFEILKTVA